MEQLLFLLIIGAIALVRWVVESANRKAEAERERQQQDPSTATLPPRNVVPTARRVAGEGANAEEERVRKFLEALGVPTTQEPPPRIEPRPLQPVPEVVRKSVEEKRQKRDIFEPFKEMRRDLPPLTTFPPPPPPVVSEEVVPPPLPQTGEAVPTTTVTFSPSVGEEVGLRRPRPTSRKRAAEPAFPDTARRSPRTHPEIRGLLRTPQGLREAILLREILGEPKGLVSKSREL